MSIFQKWITKIKSLLFTYEAGFFVFPVLAGEPELMIKGFRKTPFVTYDEEKSIVRTKTPFVDGDALFAKIDEHIWLVCTLITFKKNICFRVLHDPSNKSPFYTLTINSNISSSDVIQSQSGQKIERLSYYWEFSKPEALSKDYHSVNTTTRIFVTYVHKDWVNENVESSTLLAKKVKDWFDNPKEEILLLPHSSISRSISIDTLFGALDAQEEGSLSQLQIKADMMTFLSAFVNELNHPDSSVRTLISPKNEASMMRVERLLKESIFTGFPSIPKLSRKMGISETKLKSDFKKVFNSTIYQYYSSYQMDVAEDLLKSGNDSIRSIAFSLGYSHPGKFSAAFKKIKNISPSDVRNGIGNS